MGISVVAAVFVLAVTVAAYLATRRLGTGRAVLVSLATLLVLTVGLIVALDLTLRSMG